MTERLLKQPNTRKPKRAARIAKLCGAVLGVAVFLALTVNSLLCVFVDGYYPTFGGYRLFAIVSDSMEPNISTGDMIVGRVPKSADDISVGDVITFEVRSGGATALITHRVTEVRVASNGAITYTTKGDNAPRADSVHPAYSDVVGVYTGKKCGFFGYVFGFLQSAEGAIALIIAAFIIIITLIIARFVNLVTVWRKVALGALQKSGNILSETNDDGLGTLADVIGIVSKEPTDKTDLRRKDKKLKWFIRTGSLPKRPYSDDLDENAEMNGVAMRLFEVAAASADGVVAPLAPTASGEQTTAVAVGNENVTTVRERYETMRYDYSHTARIITLKPEAKEWYCAIKNELLSYERARSRTGKRCETFFVGRVASARIVVRGKSLAVKLPADAQKHAAGKPWLKLSGKSSTPCIVKVTSARRAKYVAELIARVMSERAKKNSDYQPRDFYLPSEGVMSLMSKGLVKRKIGYGEKLFKVTEVTDGE